MSINQVNNTTQTTYAQEVNNSQNRQKQDSLFETLLSDPKDPTEITFKEYKQLTQEEIAKLYPEDKMSKEYEKANALHTKANGTTDEILNEVMFDKELASDDSEFDKRTSKMLDSVMNFWESIEAFKKAVKKTEQYIKDNGIKFEGNPNNWICEYTKINFQMYKETVVSEDEKIISKEELFSVFEYNKIGAKTLIEYYGYTVEDNQYQYLQSMIVYEESIVVEYEKRVSENNATLASYMANNSSTQNAINQTQESSKKTESTSGVQNSSEDELNEEDRLEILRKLVEDIKSVLRTGFTVEELERMETLIAKIQKLMKDKDSNNDVEIGAKIKKLEEALITLQKRVFGEVVIELDDKNKTSSKADESKENEKKSNDPYGFQSRLDAITKSLEEMKSGKLKDAEQFNKAMEEHGLNPKSDVDVLTLRFMQDGYSKTEALERVDAYKSIGLVSNISMFEEKFGVKVYHIGFMAFNPEYKDALITSFEKMDTATLKGVVKTIEFSDAFSVDIEDAKKIMPRDGSKSHEEVMQGWKEYWQNRYGTPQKMQGLFDNLLAHHDLQQKFSVKDLSYVRDGLEVLIETYNKLKSK